MEKVMTAQEKKAKEHQDIVDRYHHIMKQEKLSFRSILIATVAIFFIVYFFSNIFLIAAAGATVFAMFAFMAYLGYFLIDAPIAEGDYNYVMKQKEKEEC